VRKKLTSIPLGIGEKRIRGGRLVSGVQAFGEHAHAVELTQGTDNCHRPIVLR
jgi:hypothetical protein